MPSLGGAVSMCSGPEEKTKRRRFILTREELPTLELVIERCAFLV